MDFENGYRLQMMGSEALKGKAPASWTPRDWGHYHKTFRRMTVTPREMAIHVWRGYAFTPVFTEARKEEFFCWAYHIALDFDTGDESSSLPFLLERPGTFAWMFASFGYSTPSSTTERPRSRVVFILDAPIHTPAEYREVYQAVAWRMAEEGSYTDPACKDALRLYYGSPRCEVTTNWSVLGVGTIQVLLEQYRAAHPPRPAAPTSKPPARPNNDYIEIRRRQILDAVRHAPEGERHTTLLRRARQAGGYVAAGYFSQNDIEQSLIEAASANSDDPPGTIERAVRDGIAHGLTAPLYLDQASSLMEIFR